VCFDTFFAHSRSSRARNKSELTPFECGIIIELLHQQDDDENGKAVINIEDGTLEYTYEARDLPAAWSLGPIGREYYEVMFKFVGCIIGRTIRYKGMLFVCKECHGNVVGESIPICTGELLNISDVAKFKEELNKQIISSRQCNMSAVAPLYHKINTVIIYRITT